MPRWRRRGSSEYPPAQKCLALVASVLNGNRVFSMLASLFSSPCLLLESGPASSVSGVGIFMRELHQWDAEKACLLLGGGGACDQTQHRPPVYELLPHHGAKHCLLRSFEDFDTQAPGFPC
eukprot:TRINITY_DN556_c1_g1_i1.p3 TRINITY_DN556_c1_g1~~TRINITY_DN556_c1_g1_i1.p3  ORF type:complete len:121 (-),score=16.47 TRINITY_DN556_c1_g1_i1:531-893(-)